MEILTEKQVDKQVAVELHCREMWDTHREKYLYRACVMLNLELVVTAQERSSKSSSAVP